MQTGKDVNKQCKGRSDTAPSLAEGPLCAGTLHFSNSETQTGVRAPFHLSQDKNVSFQPKKMALLVPGGATAWRKQMLGFAVGIHQLKDLGHFIVQLCTSKSSFPGPPGAGHWDREHNPCSELS